MGLSFAIKTNCVLQEAPARDVKVAGGGALVSDSIAHDCEFSINKHNFAETFRVLNLPDHEIILGCDWLGHHSPFTMDFQKFALTIQKDGSQ
jgi:hypothetical protein